MSLERREWDSNPRALADKRFSRPPRYDHFDISPSVAVFHAAKIILAKTSTPVNTFFYFFDKKVAGLPQGQSGSLLLLDSADIYALYEVILTEGI